MTATSDTRDRSPRILGCSWGRLDIEGCGTVKDAKLYPGGARAWDWQETGTRHEPGIQPADIAELLEQGAERVVLATGVYERLKVCPETCRELDARGVAYEILPTPEAVQTYNRLREHRAIGALIHSTC